MNTDREVDVDCGILCDCGLDLAGPQQASRGQWVGPPGLYMYTCSDAED